MKRTIMTTGDGSKTIHMPDLNEQYHSKHGALQEALHVFIHTGLEPILKSRALSSAKDPIHILEYGFGTGLNAMITYQHQQDIVIDYTGVEAYPVTPEEIAAMNYGELLNDAELYHKIHQQPWGEQQELCSYFKLEKQELKFEDLDGQNEYDLIYFDAFGPRTQPDLWVLDIFKQAYRSLKKDGVLVTYCAQGQARRYMQEAGFTVERLPGPPGKREMLRATR
jgi:tRNA U34 5-methylaminomethyl-2-thiouridine-forming methyltransferase MnmC